MKTQPDADHYIYSLFLFYHPCIIQHTFHPPLGHLINTVFHKRVTFLERFHLTLFHGNLAMFFFSDICSPVAWKKEIAFLPCSRWEDALF